MGVFHLMFFVGLQSEGRFFSLETPNPDGPRHCGQFVPLAPAAAAKIINEAKTVAAGTIPRAILISLSLSREQGVTPPTSPRTAYYFELGAPKAKTCFSPRTMIRPSEIAGVAIITSPTGFVASSSYFGPVFTTKTS